MVCVFKTLQNITLTDVRRKIDIMTSPFVCSHLGCNIIYVCISIEQITVISFFYSQISYNTFSFI
jgi:hypothetical protein